MRASGIVSSKDFPSRELLQKVTRLGDDGSNEGLDVAEDGHVLRELAVHLPPSEIATGQLRSPEFHTKQLHSPE